MVLGFLLGVLYLFTDFSYCVKWVASYIALRLRKIGHHARFDLYDYETTNEPEKVGFLVPEEETKLETPLPEEQLRDEADEIFMYGVNCRSECVVLRISRACEEKSDAWIYLKLSDGRRYYLQETSGHQRNFGGKCTAFSCGGLQMYYLSPMRRWRVVFCGMLKEMNSNRGGEDRSAFVKFTFLWTASSEVYDFESDLQIKPTAHAMAKEKWNSSFPPTDKLSETLNFYTQSGIITGIVTVEGQPDSEMYLFGQRRRHIGDSSHLVGCKFEFLMGFVPENGLMMDLGKTSIPGVFNNLHSGFTIHPNGTMYMLEAGLITTKISENINSKNNLTAIFTTDKKYELTGEIIGNGVHLKSELGWHGHLELHETEFEVNGFKGSGILLLGAVHNARKRKAMSVPPVFPNAKPLTVQFTDEISHLTDLTGGKGSSLGKLTKLSNQMKSFIVPKGIVVTTAAYTEFLTPEILLKIENLKNVAYGNIKGNVQEACNMVMQAIEKAYLPDKIMKDIEEKLQNIFNDNINQHKFAVRSSATGEDTDQMSAAGQMETFLGVQGLKQIYTAVKKCWASQFGNIAVEYKRQYGQILNSPMAVVIQEMVNCEAAGVLFTCDPVTNNPSVVVITGNYGLGESVVSGSEEPDTVILEKKEDRKVSLKSVAIGLKQHMIVVPDAGKATASQTSTEDVPEDKQKKCCISNEMSIQLGNLSLEIEDYYKSPRDIEWGVRNNTIYMLQSRPVTTGTSPSEYELKHEFDGPLRCEEEYYTFNNSSEVLPRATSPLGSEVVLKFYNMLYMKEEVKKYQSNSFLQGKYYSIGLMFFYNHLTLGVVDVLTFLSDMDSIESKSMMISIFARILDDPGMKTQAKYKEWKRKKPPLMKMLYQFYSMFFSGVGLEDLRRRVFSYKFPLERCKTSIQTFDEIVHSCSNHLETFLKHNEVSFNSSIWNMIMMNTLGKAKGGLDTDVYSDFAKLLSSSSVTDSAVESADIPNALQKLAAQIVKEIKSEDFKAMSVEKSLEWLENSNTSASVQYKEFIKRHGHRCIKEADVHSIPWYMDPKPLIKNLQNLSGLETDKKEKEGDISKILSELKVPLNWKTRLMLKFVVPNCRRGVREREYCKSILIKYVDYIRKGYHHLSKQMVAEGYLTDSDLLYFLTNDEIKEVLHARNPKLISRAIQRRKLFPTLDDLLFPEINKGRPIPVNEQKEEVVEYDADLTMKGIPVSQGSVKAYARVAMTLEEAANLKKGEVLITYSTDIAWSPYFPILSGVVTELGGLISHGAVVSREYGLPCVVGLHGATKKFQTGDYVYLDGNKGILQRIPAPEK